MKLDLESIEFYFKEENLLIPDVNFVSEQRTLNGIKIILNLVSCILHPLLKTKDTRRKIQVDLDRIKFYFMEKNYCCPMSISFQSKELKTLQNHLESCILHPSSSQKNPRTLLYRGFLIY